MKKLLALVLSVIMAASLAAPAFAAPGPSPEEAASLGIIGGADGPTAIITSGSGGSIASESYECWMAEDEYLAEHPGLEDELRASAYDYFAQEYRYYESAQEYMEIWELTEEEFLERMVRMQASDRIQAELRQREMDAVKQALGGVPGQIGVMVNGQYIKFPDAAPEIANGRTMVPVRALMEALGGEVEMMDGRVVCKTDEIRLTFTPGSDEVLVEYPGGEFMSDGQIFPLGCAPYVKGGRAYVPLRFLAEALGCEVGWDSKYETAILLDREAMAAQFDESFTILNRVLANGANPIEEGENYRYDVRCDVTATAFDTLHGNKTYKGDFTGKTLLNAEAVSGAYSITLSDNVLDKLMEHLVGYSWDDEEEYAEEVAALRKFLGGLKDMEIIMNREGLAWFHAPVLDELGGEDDVWCGFDMGAELADILFAGTDATTVGTMLAAGMGTNSIMDYSAVGSLAQMMFDIYGDEKFTTAGGTSTLTIDLDDLEELESGGTLGTGYNYYDYKEYQFTMKVDSRGGVTLTCTAETAAQYGMPAMRVSMDGSLSDRQVSMTLDYHVANVGELKVALTAQRQTTGEEPLSEPPEGANIVDAAEMLGY